MIDPTEMVTMLTQTEEALYDLGWGQPALLAQIKAPDGKVPFPMAISNTLPHPHGASLMRIAVSMAQDPHFGSEITDANPDLVGLMFCAEAWSVLDAPDWVDASNVSQQPDAEHSRELILVDIWGRTFTANRIKGKDQATAQQVMLEGGRVPIALAYLLRVLATHLPAADLAGIDFLISILDPNIDADMAINPHGVLP